MQKARQNGMLKTSSKPTPNSKTLGGSPSLSLYARTVPSIKAATANGTAAVPEAKA
jgi:hypothetical protein